MMRDDSNKNNKKRVGIMTFHRANNYGAVLQAYALCEFLNNGNSITCEIIDYISSYMEKQYKPFIVSTSSIKDFVLSLLYCPIRIKRSKKYARFRRDYYKLSGVSYSKKDIKEANNKYDYFVFGSDQIWNNKLNGDDSAFFGEFVWEEKDKISYAASFGELLDDKKNYQKYKEYLKDFKKVSLREKKGSRLYKELTGKNASEVMDPVFLLDKKQWGLLCEEKSFNYILVYHLQGNKTKVDEYARELSKRTGLPIVELQVYIKAKHRNIRFRHADSPNDFLSWIKNADYVITDSFHCTAFSIIFEKNFWAFVPSDKPIEDTRVGNLLTNLHLVDRRVKTDVEEFVKGYDLPIDYSVANLKKNELIGESKEFLEIIMNGQ